jgi:uncharacterized protein (DUF433 family)
MSAATAIPHIEKPAGGSARLARRPRVRVAQVVMDHLAHGWSVEEMCRQHPDLTPAEAHAAMLYYWENREEIDDEIRVEWDQARDERAKADPSPFAVRLRALGLL